MGIRDVRDTIADMTWEMRWTSRMLIQRDRAFAVTVVAMLTVAIALNVIVFTVADAMVFRGYPLVKRNDRLVMVQEVFASNRRGIAFPDFDEWAAGTRLFQGMAAVAGGRMVQVSEGRGQPSYVTVWRITPNMFGLLDVGATIGRDFGPADAAAGSPPVAILSYRFWVSRYGARPEVLGSTILIDGSPATIVGVMPERFEFPHQGGIWTPIVRTAGLRRPNAEPDGYFALGRLRPGATVEQARAELDTIHARLQSAFPETNGRLLLSVVDNAHAHAGPDAPLIYGSLWAGACLVLLIACANVSNLMLVRTVGRSREISTMIALGAGPWRMICQVLVESFSLASMAGALAWWCVKWGVRTWAAATASPFQILDYRVDWSTLAYLTAVSGLTAIVCSLGPMSRVAGLRVHGALSGGARGITQAPRSKRLAAALVSGQMALAIVLLSGAGILVRSLANIVNAETGVRDPASVLVGSIRLPPERYATPAKRNSYINALAARLAVPGVEDASVSSSLPVKGGRMQAFEVEGQPVEAGREPNVQFVWLGAGYFRVAGAPMMAGRDFDGHDSSGAPGVAIVNQSFADTYARGRGAVGMRLRVVARGGAGDWLTVVGVAPNIMEGDAVRQHFKPVVYLPIRQDPPLRLYFLARVRAGAPQVARAVRVGIEQLDPDVALEPVSTLKAMFAFDGDYMDLEHMELGKEASVAPVFAAIALLVAALGLYAVIASWVGQRTQEIGVRIAIGAAASDIRRLVFRGGMWPAASGVLAGLAASLAVNRILQSQLVGVSPYDPVTFGAALTLLLSVALLACAVPARRATRVDPVVALRYE